MLQIGYVNKSVVQPAGLVKGDLGAVTERQKVSVIPWETRCPLGFCDLLIIPMLKSSAAPRNSG